MILGIDPGLSGALVILDGDCIYDFMHMPQYMVANSNRVNCTAIGRWLDKILTYNGIELAKVELVHAMPKQGVASMFTFGHSVGSVMGVLGAFGIPVEHVRPQAWKKAAGLSGTDKDAARSRAISLWPNWAELDKKTKGQALADAALIARFG